MKLKSNILTEDIFIDSVSNPVTPPLYQTSLFTFPDTASLQAAMDHEASSYLYSRGNNPTVEQVERKIALLEGCERAKLLSAGVAAIATGILSCVSSGDHIICAEESYGWARYITGTYLKRFGVDVTFVDVCDIASVERAIRKNTKVLYLESPSSLVFRVQDLRALADLARSHGITTIVDNTWATPLYQNPIELGIDMVVHSASKYLGGHSDVVGGVIAGSEEAIVKIFEQEYLPIGQVPDPFQAWLIHRGMRTLHVRLPYHYASALQVCDYLWEHPAVAEVNYPMHPKSPWYELATSQMSGGCGLLSFRVKNGDPERVAAMVESLKMFRIGVSWGGYESLVFPNFATRSGDPALIRIHVGLEDTGSLIRDIDNAFRYLV